MKPERLIKEVKFGIYKVRFLRAFLGASTVFLTTYISLMLMGIPAVQISILIGVLFLITELVVLSKNNPLVLVEDFYDSVNEELRTLSDNASKKNELVLELADDVRKKVKKFVDMGDFVDFRKVLTRLLFIFFLSFAIILLASLNVQIPGIDRVINESQNMMLNLNEKLLENPNIQVFNSDSDLKMNFKKLASQAGIGGGDQAGGQIFGDAQIVELGNEKINIEINPTDFEVSIEDFEDVKDKDFTERPFQDEVHVSSSAGFEENIPQDKAEIVKRYFKKLAQE